MKESLAEIRGRVAGAEGNKTNGIDEKQRFILVHNSFKITGTWKTKRGDRGIEADWKSIIASAEAAGTR